MSDPDRPGAGVAVNLGARRVLPRLKDKHEAIPIVTVLVELEFCCVVRLGQRNLGGTYLLYMVN
jgi:hypothetical protein